VASGADTSAVHVFSMGRGPRFCAPRAVAASKGKPHRGIFGCSTEYSLGSFGGSWVFGVSTGSPEKKLEVVGGRADVPRDPAMAGGAAHSIQDCTPFLAKPNQQGEGTQSPEPALQIPCSPF